MTKISIDIESIKTAIEEIGYEISDCIERENNGYNWQIKFHNSGAVVTIYDTNTKKNTVVNGKCEEGESDALKKIVDGIKCKELSVDVQNAKIVELINSKKEANYYDFKQQWHSEKKDADLLHDILCLANNIDNVDAYLIIGINDAYEVVGVGDWKKSHELIDYVKSKGFAGGHMPDFELLQIFYKFHKIDVLWIKSSKYVPFYITKKYKDVGTQIYTRVGDTNTPKDESANYNDIEKLWRIHFEREND